MSRPASLDCCTHVRKKEERTTIRVGLTCRPHGFFSPCCLHVGLYLFLIALMTGLLHEHHASKDCPQKQSMGTFCMVLIIERVDGYELDSADI